MRSKRKKIEHRPPPTCSHALPSNFKNVGLVRGQDDGRQGRRGRQDGAVRPGPRHRGERPDHQLHRREKRGRHEGGLRHRRCGHEDGGRRHGEGLRDGAGHHGPRHREQRPDVRLHRREGRGCQEDGRRHRRRRQAEVRRGREVCRGDRGAVHRGTRRPQGARRQHVPAGWRAGDGRRYGRQGRRHEHARDGRRQSRRRQRQMKTGALISFRYSCCFIFRSKKLISRHASVLLPPLYAKML
ncbi:hypothetical protein D1007_15087 [Hordeum vulgare]|nr:hypothetical protein D1007_15087 [Hordeum vulgare]